MVNAMIRNNKNDANKFTGYSWNGFHHTNSQHTNIQVNVMIKHNKNDANNLQNFHGIVFITQTNSQYTNIRVNANIHFFFLSRKDCKKNN